MPGVGGPIWGSCSPHVFWAQSSCLPGQLTPEASGSVCTEPGGCSAHGRPLQVSTSPLWPVVFLTSRWDLAPHAVPGGARVFVWVRSIRRGSALRPLWACTLRSLACSRGVKPGHARRLRGHLSAREGSSAVSAPASPPCLGLHWQVALWPSWGRGLGHPSICLQSSDF